MADNLYTLEQAQRELRKLYPMLEFELIEEEHALVCPVFGQFKVMVELEDEQFLTSFVVDETERSDDYEFNPLTLTPFICDSAPMGVNQVIRKAQKYVRGLSANLQKWDSLTFKRKRKINAPPLVTHEQRRRIADLEKEGFTFTGTTYEEAQAFIEEVG